jgi:hypothetical protein
VTFAKDGFVFPSGKAVSLTLESAGNQFITGVGYTSNNNSGVDIDQSNLQYAFRGGGITPATFDLGDILPTNLTQASLLNDLTVYYLYSGGSLGDGNGIPADVIGGLGSVPEPGSLGLLGIGALGLLARRRRRIAKRK